MKTKSDPRHQSRIISLQKLFELEFNSNSQYTISDFIDINESPDIVIDAKLVEKIVKGVESNLKIIDDIIKKYTIKRSFQETSKIDLLILRMSVFEMLFEKDPPPLKVVIDEAVELGKEFGGDKSAHFINGVLGSLTTDINNGKYRKS